MKTVSAILLAAVVLAALSVTPVTLSQAASTFIGSTIMEIQPDGHKVTIRTIQGEKYSLDVADPEAIKGVKQGDQVSLELDPQDRVHKIVKMGEPTGTPPKKSSSDSEY
jgi:Cu/Ag efflux protein CusF